MPTETTASLLVGASRDTSWLADGFRPDHLLLLNEGSRAWWTIHPTAESEPAACRVIIRPASPENLLAAGLLGFLALAAPAALAANPRLQDLVTVEDDNVTIRPVCRHRSDEAIALFASAAGGVLTLMPGTSVRPSEVRGAQRRGLTVARSVRTPVTLGPADAAASAG